RSGSVVERVSRLGVVRGLAMTGHKLAVLLERPEGDRVVEVFDARTGNGIAGGGVLSPAATSVSIGTRIVFRVASAPPPGSRRREGRRDRTRPAQPPRSSHRGAPRAGAGASERRPSRESQVSINKLRTVTPHEAGRACSEERTLAHGFVHSRRADALPPPDAHLRDAGAQKS